MKKIRTSTTIVSLLIAVVVIGLLYYFVIRDDSKTVDNADIQKGVQNVAQNTKENAGLESSKASGLDTNNNTEPPKSSGSLASVSLSNLTFSQSGGSVKASAKASSSQQGTCYFGFSSSGTKPVSRTSQSTSESSGQTCTIQIPEVEFTKLGTWRMIVSFTQNSAKVESSQDVTIH